MVYRIREEIGRDLHLAGENQIMLVASNHAIVMAYYDRECLESSLSKSSTAGASATLWFAFILWGADGISAACSISSTGVSHRSLEMGLNSFRARGSLSWGFWFRPTTDYHSELCYSFSAWD